jgi:hypothetical protein
MNPDGEPSCVLQWANNTMTLLKEAHIAVKMPDMTLPKETFESAVDAIVAEATREWGGAALDCMAALQDVKSVMLKVGTNIRVVRGRARAQTTANYASIVAKERAVSMALMQASWIVFELQCLRYTVEVLNAYASYDEMAVDRSTWFNDELLIHWSYKELVPAVVQKWRELKADGKDVGSAVPTLLEIVQWDGVTDGSMWMHLWTQNAVNNRGANIRRVATAVARLVTTKEEKLRN